MAARSQRGAQRLRLPKPILGLLNSENVLILDIGLGGALVEHHGLLAIHNPVRLLFRWKNQDVEFEGEAIASEVIRGEGASSISHTEIAFRMQGGDAERALGDMMAGLIAEVLAAQRLNASGERTDGGDFLSTLGGARRSRSRGYVTYRLGADGNWTRSSTRSPQQPEDGFTVAQYEADEDLRVLCRTWELGDDEARRMIRLVAEMSARTVRKV